MNWPHAPRHWFDETGSYFITASTYLKQSLFKSAADLDYLQETMFSMAAAGKCDLEGWSFFPNHYHLVVQAMDNPRRLRNLIHDVHATTARELNSRYEVFGRKVWFQYRDTHLTFQKSYMARLNYVHQNPVHHGVVSIASSYRWGSAAWFEQNASRAFAESVRRFKIDRLRIPDDFVVEKT